MWSFCLGPLDAPCAPGLDTHHKHLLQRGWIWCLQETELDPDGPVSFMLNFLQKDKIRCLSLDLMNVSKKSTLE